VTARTLIRGLGQASWARSYSSSLVGGQCDSAGVLASHSRGEVRQKFVARATTGPGIIGAMNGAPSPRGAPRSGPAGGQGRRHRLRFGALATRALAAPNGPRGRRMLAGNTPSLIWSQTVVAARRRGIAVP